MLIISVIIAFTGVSLLLTYIEFQGRKKIGASPLHVFRAFLIDWLDWKNELFEEYLEGLGCYQPISITLIGFKKKGGGQLKGVVAVSNFHPGPFLNIGSSVLPSLIQTFIEKKTGAVVAVPHGVSGHESNLVSQRQNERVLRKIEDLLNFSQFSSFASPFIRFEIGYGKASCQIFGENALATLTLSPRSMEDIPAEVAEALSSWSENCPEDAALIDAHNCIDDLALTTDEELDDLKKSLKMAVETAAKEPRLPFKVGVAKLSLKDFTLDQGIGPGGLVVLLVETRSQLAGYITIDGNNMAMGLREKILRKLREMGVSDGEVMTTDTHMVNGIVSAKHGYHPVGESIDQKKLIEYVEVAVNEAKNNLEEAEVAWKSAEVEVKVLGSKALRRLINFLYSNIKLVAISMIPVVAVPIIVCLAILL
jgi:putative membrane protein